MTAPTARSSVLIVDDDARVRLSIQRLLEKQGYAVETAGTAAEGLAVVRDKSIALALVDFHLPDGTAADLIRPIHAISPATAVVVVTGQGAVDLALRVLDEGACDYYEKPIRDWPRFYQVLRRSIELHQKDEEIARLRAQARRLQGSPEGDPCRELIGHSEAMRTLRRQILHMGPLGATVLVTGESGVGKERVAHAVHLASTNRSGPYVAVNCAGLQKNLIESELFGHMPGVFTDGRHLKLGLCDIAENGTLFLDEIGDLPFDMQAKLLRMLNEKEFRRIGGTKNIPLKARVISATNVDLRRAISEGRFREDLFFRLNVFEIHVPPLRERKEDVAHLAYHFVQKYNADFNRNVRRLSPGALAALEAHDWARNNVRELERTIQRAVALCDWGDEITPDMLSIGEGDTRPAARADARRPAIPPSAFALEYPEAKELVVHDFTVEYVQRRLAEANGNITRAAELSGMQRSNFSTMMSRHGLKREDGDRRLKG